MSDTPLYDAAAALASDWDGAREVCELCERLERENLHLKTALGYAARWGIRSDGFSAEVSDSLRGWVDSGMVGDPPAPPTYYPT